MPKKCGSLESEARQKQHRPELCSLSCRPLSYLNAVSSDDNKQDLDPLTFQSRSNAYGMHDLAKRDRRDPTEEKPFPVIYCAYCSRIVQGGKLHIPCVVKRDHWKGQSRLSFVLPSEIFLKEPFRCTCRHF